MSKLFSDRRTVGFRRSPGCIYCGLPADSRDHVPPKLLLERPYPPNLLTVPSCARCNQGWSQDEQYVLALLSQIGTSQVLTNKLATGGVVDRALRRRPLLERRLHDALQTDEEGRILIAAELDRVHKVVSKIAQGLYVLRYKSNPGLARFSVRGVYPYNIREDRPAPVFVSTFTERFKPKIWETVQKGIFSYIFVRNPSTGPALWCILDVHSTLWAVIGAVSPKRNLSAA
jgi:hypothetical protein